MNSKTITRLKEGQIVKVSKGFYARRRGDRTVWLLRYTGPNRVQREFIFGCLSPDGLMGTLAATVAHERLGQQVDFEAALLASKGAREPIPAAYAEAIARRLRTMIEGGRDLVVELKQKRAEAVTEEAERQDRSVKAVGERWVRHLRREGKRSADEVGRTLERHVYPRIGAKDVGKVGRADAHRIHDAIVDEGKASTAAMVARLLRALMSYAADRGLVPMNPLLRMKLGGTKARKRILIKFHPEREPDASELFAVWAAANVLTPVRGACIRTLILTGQRLREVSRMTWAEIDGGVWTIPPERHKGQRGHEVPLPRQALEEIEALPRVSEWVFAGRGGRPLGDFSQIKEDLDKASGVTNWVLHDLRRTCATWLREVGFSRDDVDDVLGHSLPALVSTYQRGPAYQRKKAALQSWADFVTSAKSDKVVSMVREAHAREV